MFGTIDRLVFLDCSIGDFADVTDATEWATYVDACRVKASNRLLASKGESSPTQTRLAGCLTDETTGVVHTISFTDHYVDCPQVGGAWAVYEFWKYIQEQQRGLALAWLICGNNCALLQGFAPEFSINVSQTIPETKQEAIGMAGTITYEGVIDMGAVLVGADVIAEINRSVGVACP